MKNVRCYDNGGKTADRYTVVFMSMPVVSQGVNHVYMALGMDAYPFSPQGIGMSTTAVPGRHLGLRIRFEDLPEDCKRCVTQYMED